MKIAVVIPCFNEAMTIAKVVSDFRRELPDADVIVFDNRSTDGSAEIARGAGASVEYVSRQGKGAVIRHIFREIDADVYVMADGDDTYPAEHVHELIRPVAEGAADMAIGDRLSGGQYEAENKRAFHNFGNILLRRLVNYCFKSDIRDIMTGYRVFSKRFARSVPVLSDGFEVETEMTIRSLARRMSIVEVRVPYRDRPEGSVSKLRTFRDGFRVLGAFFRILKDYRPMFFFGLLSLCSMAAGLVCGVPVIVEFVMTRFITHVPLAILATGFVLVAMTMLICGVILDTMVSQERQRNEIDILRFGKKR
jgi:glycosyltransferase involved in cell wall biosynthesis